MEHELKEASHSVLHILAGGGTGGIETLCAEYAYASAHRNVFLILWKSGEIADEMRDKGIDVVELNASGKSTIQIVRAIEITVKRFGIDTLVVHHASPKAHVYMQLVRMRNRKLHTVAYAHGLAGVMCRDDERRGLAFRRMVFRWSLKKSDMIIAVSEASKKSLIEYFGCDESKIHVVYNGVNTEKFSRSHSESTSEHCRESASGNYGESASGNHGESASGNHGKSASGNHGESACGNQIENECDCCAPCDDEMKGENTLRIVYVGRLIEGKGVQITLRALAMLKNRMMLQDEKLKDNEAFDMMQHDEMTQDNEVRSIMPQSKINIHFDVVGDGEYRGELERLTNELDIGEYVTFLGNRRDVPKLLMGEDVFVHVPTLEEGFGITIIEAMAAGFICICSRSGAIGEIVQDGVNGIMIDKADAAGLAEALMRIAEMDTEERIRFRNEAVARAEDFNVARFVAELDGLIRLIG